MKKRKKYNFTKQFREEEYKELAYQKLNFHRDLAERYVGDSQFVLELAQDIRTELNNGKQAYDYED